MRYKVPWLTVGTCSTTPNHLLSIFAPFGPIESARVLTHKSCGVSQDQPAFVNVRANETELYAVHQL